MIKNVTIKCSNCSCLNALSTCTEHNTDIKKYFWCKECNHFQGYLISVQDQNIEVIHKLAEIVIEPIQCKKTNISISPKKSRY